MLDTKRYFECLNSEKVKPGKRLHKIGTLNVDDVETTPLIWKNKLFRCEWTGRLNNKTSYTHFVDMEDEKCIGHTADSCLFPSAYTENDRMFVYAVSNDNKELLLFWSDDLLKWESKSVFKAPEKWTLFNTSVCKSPDGYTMALEVAGPKEILGEPFTIVFLKSSDLYNWELLDIAEYLYDMNRYTACPVVRYVDGMYYMIYLEEMPIHHYVPYIVRTKDLKNYELGIINPVMFYDDDDRKIVYPEKFTADEIDRIHSSPNINNSDVDICEYNGKTIIMYSWGNQFGKEFLAMAEYDGTMEEFLKSFFC